MNHGTKGGSKRLSVTRRLRIRTLQGDVFNVWLQASVAEPLIPLDAASEPAERYFTADSKRPRLQQRLQPIDGSWGRQNGG
ncbi:hypothetical protein Vi05172_g5920 [Venturia inaequalis]|nr:hypothetical protein Vi05172_g5920 [Venturia inaequalis]